MNVDNVMVPELSMNVDVWLLMKIFSVIVMVIFWIVMESVGVTIQIVIW